MKKRKLKQTLQYEIFLIPAFIAFTTFTIIPLIKTIMYSVTDFDGVRHEMNFVGLKNFITVFQDEVMRHSLFNTIFYTFCTMVLINLLAIPLAVFLDKKTKIKSLERAVFFFPSIVSALLLGYVWGYILSPMQTGALNSLLSIFDVGPFGFTATEWGAKISIILVAVWTSTGWYATIYLAYLQAIPSEYYEAAAIDGASKWQQFKSVTLPMLAPGLTVNTLLLLTNGLKVYDLPYALTKGGPGYSNYTVTQVIIQRGLSEKQYGPSTALATIFIIIVAVIATVQYMTMRKREEDLS
ncbi:MAG TPA: sugar ABC transporter permease [Candidatus Limivivens merdigallinarum]|uniref:Sugar ABC transporter permease n=1 Tax=Candidatus Limivivens merdigallinarum TaxID=2840859 RepID=A0A9D0ZUB2_9FIRM|nr:sugar ABC transporter permease [Candidatus Limivivens merdigallinarum]